MKKLVFLLMSIFVFCCCQPKAEHYEFVLKGEISGIKYGKAYLTRLNEKDRLCEAEIEGGRFQLKGVFDEAGQYVLHVNRRAFAFFMDGDEMKITCPYTELKNIYLKGSPANDLEIEYGKLMDSGIYQKRSELLNEYQIALNDGDEKRSDEIMTQVLKLGDKSYKLTKEFIQKHPENIFSAYIANVVKEDSYERGSELYDLLANDIKESFFGMQLKKNVDALAVSALGGKCPDFQVKDEDGNIVTLNSLKGQILILDFWASWCGPCRQEMKNLRRQYDEFKDRGVQIMSVSLDDSIEKWKQACEEEQIPWISTHDENGWKNSEIRKLFGIQSIPFIVLLDKDGNIVAKNIRRNLLRDKVLELLNKNE